jgi:hypothetical protein
LVASASISRIRSQEIAGELDGELEDSLDESLHTKAVYVCRGAEGREPA